MKKIILSFLLLLVLGLGLASCDRSKNHIHLIGDLEQTDPTCTDTGLKPHYFCTLCGQYFDEDKNEVDVSSLVLQPVGHDFDDGWKANALYHWHECSRCAVIEDKAEHTFDDGVIVKEATETEKGLKVYTCTVCGLEKDEEIARLQSQEINVKDDEGEEIASISFVDEEQKFDSGADLVVNQVAEAQDDKATYLEIIAKATEEQEPEEAPLLLENESIAQVYEVKIMVNDKEVQPEGRIKVRLAIDPELIGVEFAIVHIHYDEDARRTFTRIEYTDLEKSELSSGFVSFEVDRLSEFAIVTERKEVVNHKVTITNPDGATIKSNFADLTQVPETSKVTLDITAKDHYHLTKVTVDGKDVDNMNHIEITINSDVEIVIRQEIDKHSFESEAVNGSITPENNTVDYNTPVEFTVTPAEKYELSKILINGKEVNIAVADNKFTIHITEDMHIEAICSLIPVKVTVRFDTDGAGDIADKEYIQGKPIGELPTVSKEGYEFKGWSYDGELIDEDFIVNEDIKLKAVFEIYTFDITFIANNGKVDIANAKLENVEFNTIVLVKENTIQIGEIVVTATADDGYQFVKFAMDNYDSIPQLVREDMEIKVIFKEEVNYHLASEDDILDNAKFVLASLYDNKYYAAIGHGNKFAVKEVEVKDDKLKADDSLLILTIEASNNDDQWYIKVTNVDNDSKYVSYGDSGTDFVLSDDKGNSDNYLWTFTFGDKGLEIANVKTNTRWVIYKSGTGYKAYASSNASGKEYAYPQLYLVEPGKNAHDYQFDSFVWSYDEQDDVWTAQAKFICGVDGCPKPIKLYDATVVEDEARHVNPTTTEAGLMVLVATYKTYSEEKEVVIEKLPDAHEHNYVHQSYKYEDGKVYDVKKCDCGIIDNVEMPIVDAKDINKDSGLVAVRGIYCSTDTKNSVYLEIDRESFTKLHLYKSSNAGLVIGDEVIAVGTVKEYNNELELAEGNEILHYCHVEYDITLEANIDLTLDDLGLPSKAYNGTELSFNLALEDNQLATVLVSGITLKAGENGYSFVVSYENKLEINIEEVEFVEITFDYEDDKAVISVIDTTHDLLISIESGKANAIQDAELSIGINPNSGYQIKAVTGATNVSETIYRATAEEGLIIKVELEEVEVNTYNIITDANLLEDGAKIILVARDGDNYYALSTNQANNNRTAVEISFDENGNISLPADSNVQVITLEKEDNNWALNVGNGYLYAASSSANYLRTQENIDDNARWLVTLDAEDSFKLQAQGSNANSIIRFNPNKGNPIFASYASTSKVGSLPFIYALNTGEEKVTVYFDANGGDIVDNSIRVLKGASITLDDLVTVSYPGHQFVGWTLNNELVEFPLVVNEEITLVAKWEEHKHEYKYTIEWDEYEAFLVSTCPSCDETTDGHQVKSGNIAGVSTNNPSTCAEAGYKIYTLTGLDKLGISEDDLEPNQLLSKQEDLELLPHGELQEVEKDVTEKVTMSEYASAHNWGSSSNEGQDEVVGTNFTVKLTATDANSGKYYSDWRLYQKGAAEITISSEKELVSVKFTFTVSNTGQLNYGSQAVVSGTAVTVSGNSATFTVGNSGTAENGQVRITVIEVTYLDVVEEYALKHFEAKEAKCTEAGNKEAWYCSRCEQYFADKDATTLVENFVIPALGHEFDESDIVWNWAENHSSVEVTVTCDRCHEVFINTVLNLSENPRGQIVEDPQGVFTATLIIDEKTSYTNVIDTNHTHTYDTYVIEWVDLDPYLYKICSSCEATIEGHKVLVDKLNTNEEVTNPTCEEAGYTTYTAVLPLGITISNPDDIVKVVAGAIALGHEYNASSYEYDSDNDKVTRACTRCHEIEEIDIMTSAEAIAFTSELENGDYSDDVIAVKGIVYSSEYKSNYSNYTIWLRNGNTNKAFELYRTVIGLEGDYTAQDALKNKVVIAVGYAQKYVSGNYITYELTEINNLAPIVLDITDAAFAVNIADMTNGNVSADKATGVKVGETVTLTVTPAEGYRLLSLTVVDEYNNNVAVNNGSFVMPLANVTVNAEFEELPTTAILSFDLPENDKASISGIEAGEKPINSLIEFIVDLDYAYEIVKVEKVVGTESTPLEMENEVYSFTLTDDTTIKVTIKHKCEQETQGETTYQLVEETSDLAVNDVVVIVYNAEKVLSGISNTSTKYGLDAGNISAPTYLLTLVAGSTSGSYSFKTNDNKYLTWTSGNSLNVADSISNNSSWTIDISNGTATVANVADTNRVLKYNTGSPRFACYTSGQSPIQIYKQVVEAGSVEIVHSDYQLDADWDNFVYENDDYVNAQLICGVCHEVIEEDIEAEYAIIDDKFVASYTYKGIDYYDEKEIIKEDLTNLAVKLDGWTYGEEPNEPVVTGNIGGGLEYIGYRQKGAEVFVDIVPTDAGVYEVEVFVTDTTFYNAATAYAEFTIAKANLPQFAVTLADWNYGGNSNEPVVTGNLENGEVTYLYKAKADEDSEYKSDKPVHSNTYVVKATVAETANYNSATATAEFDILAEIRWVNQDVNPSVTIYTYVKTGVLPVYGGEIPTKASDDKYTYSFAGWKDGKDQDVSIVTPNCDIKAYIAQFNAIPRSYAVTLNVNGGTINSGNVTTYTFGIGATLPTDVTRTGYTFAGWYANVDLDGDPVTAVSNILTGNIEFWAKWRAVEYTITYNLDGGTNNVNNPAKYTIEDVVVFGDPTKAGWQFINWTDDNNNNDEITGISVGSTGNISITAHWTQETLYYITYNLNGGSVDGNNPTSFTESTETFTLINPTKTGYTFTGWTGSNGEVAQEEVTIPQGSTGDKAYTANWNAIEFTISFVGLDKESIVATYDVAYNITNPTRAGYTFDGWESHLGDGFMASEAKTGTTADPDTAWDGETATKDTYFKNLRSLAGEVILTAHWSINTYSINYDLAGGSVEGNPATFNVETPTFILNNPTRVGYTFAGWTGNGLNGPTMEVTIEQGSTGDRSYKATWSIVTYTLTYNLDGGNVSTPNPATYDVETPTFTLNNPTKLGYDFTGWTGSNGEVAQEEVTIPQGSIGDKAYTANWSIVTYTLTYNLDGGSVSTPNPATYNVETPTFTLNNPTKTGYTFNGWIGSNGPIPQETVTIVKGSTGEKTFNTHWTAQQYTITYKDQGNVDFSGNHEDGYPTTHTYGTATTLNAATKDNYVFGGWYVNPECTGTAVTTLAAEGYTANITLYAKWDEAKAKVDNTYYLTFEEAYNNASSTNKVVLLADATTSENADLDADKIDFNGHTITLNKGSQITNLDVQNINSLDVVVNYNLYQQSNETTWVVASNTYEKTVNNKVEDVLNKAFTGRTGTSYGNWNNEEATSSAIYAGNSAAGNESIQLRSSDNSGIITTTSGGKAVKITVDWNDSTQAGRTLDIYGKNSAYSSSADLYDTNKQGTLLGTIVKGTSTELTITGDYAYIGLRSHNGAMYITSITIEWSTTEKQNVNDAEFHAKDDMVCATDHAGKIAYWYANSQEKNYISKVNDKNIYYDIRTDGQLVIPVAHNYGEASWSVNNDKLVATFSCQNDNCNHQEVFNNDFTSTETSATCVETGKIEYKLSASFEFNEVTYDTTEIRFTEILPINSNNHDGHAERTDAIEAVGSTDGHKAYWYCSECENYYEDNDGVIGQLIGNQEAFDSWYSDPNGGLIRAHQHQKDQTFAEVTSDVAYGHKAYYYCEEDEIYFTDDEEIGDVETLEAWLVGSGIIAPTGYTVTLAATNGTIEPQLNDLTENTDYAYINEVLYVRKGLELSFALNPNTHYVYNGDIENVENNTFTVTINSNVSYSTTFVKEYEVTVKQYQNGHLGTISVNSNTVKDGDNLVITISPINDLGTGETVELSELTINDNSIKSSVTNNSVTINDFTSYGDGYTLEIVPTFVLKRSSSQNAVVEFVAGTDTGSTSVEKGNITVSMSTMSRTDNYRCYANTDMTISAENDIKITKIEITCTASGASQYGPGCFNEETGYTYSEYKGTWVGESSSVTLTSSGSQIRMTNIKVTYTVESYNSISYNSLTINGGGSFAVKVGDSSIKNRDIVNDIYYIESGSDVEITITAPNGYVINQVLDDETPLQVTDNKVTISNYSSNKELTVSYNLKYYSIEYDLAGGSVAVDNLATYTINTGTIELNAPTKNGYTFAGWTVSSGSVNGNTLTLPQALGDITVTATWAPIEYTITYNLDGGTNNGNNPATYTIEDVVVFGDPTKDDWTFVGWIDDNNNNAVITGISAGSTGNVSITAHWTQETVYSITYDLTGGSLDEDNPTTYTENTANFTLNNPTKTGYTFAGWTGTDLNSATTTVTITQGSTGNRSYTATWAPIEYTITYNLDSGTNNGNNPAKYTIEDVVVFGDPTKANCTFVNWTDDNNNNAVITGISAGSTGNVSITAHWDSGFTVTFDLNYNGATGAPEEQSVSAGGKVNAPSNPSRTGYTFADWWLRSGSVGNYTYTKWDFNENTVASNITLYARWSIDITLDYSSFGLTTSYSEKTATISGIGFTVNQGYKGSNNSIQMNSSKGSGTLYNTTAIKLKSIKVNVSSGNRQYTITTGTTENPTTNSQTGTTGGTYNAQSGDTYFQLRVSGASYFSSIVITYYES